MNTAKIVIICMLIAVLGFVIVYSQQGGEKKKLKAAVEAGYGEESGGYGEESGGYGEDTGGYGEDTGGYGEDTGGYGM